MSGARVVFKPTWVKTVNWNELNGKSGKIIIQDGTAMLLLEDNSLLIVLDELERKS